MRFFIYAATILASALAVAAAPLDESSQSSPALPNVLGRRSCGDCGTMSCMECCGVSSLSGEEHGDVHLLR